MTRNAWLTPRTAHSDRVEIRISIPNSIEYRAILRGILLLLNDPEQWENIYEVVTENDAAAAWLEAIETFEDNF